MNEKDRPSYYAQALKELSKPSEPAQLDSFCKDYQLATSIIHNLRILDEEPTLEFYELLLRLEFLIAKNKRPDLVASFSEAKENAKRIKEALVNQNPDLETQLKFKKREHLDLEDQIALSVYAPSSTDQRARNRFKYIQEAARQKSQSHVNSREAQQRFRRVYRTYSTAQSKPRP